MTKLQQAAQQALTTLESGALLCELTAASMLRVALADEQAQAVEPVKHWPFDETPGEFTARLQAAYGVFGSMLAAVRFVLIEEPPAFAHPAPPPAQQVAVPDMFWNHDDADKLYSSISEFLNDEICNGTGLAVGDIRTIQRAVRLPNIDIRITSVDDDECDADYEIVEVQGAKPVTKPDSKTDWSAA